MDYHVAFLLRLLQKHLSPTNILSTIGSLSSFAFSIAQNSDAVDGVHTPYVADGHSFQ